MEKLLYRVTEAAEMLGLSRSKVYVLIQAGVLPSVRVDGSRRIRAEDASPEGDLAPLHQLAAPGQVAGLVAGDLRRTLGGGDVVSNRLGHADPAITLRVYAHVINESSPLPVMAFAEVVARFDHEDDADDADNADRDE